MNLRDIRDAVFRQADWGPTQSDDAKARVTAFINRAYDQLALEAPFLFEGEVRFATQRDYEGSASDTLSVSTTDLTPNAQNNAWVLQRGAAATASDPWPKDRSWDGRIIELTDAAGNTVRNRIRTVFSEGAGQVERDHLTVLQPVDVARYGEGPFTYRIYTDHYYLPDDIVQFKSARLWEANYDWPLTVLGQDEAEQRSLAARRSDLPAGLPRAMFRRSRFAIPGPKVPPAVALTPLGGAGWMGPEPPGQFDYVITYTWGKRDANFRNGGVGHWDGNALPWEDLIAGPRSEEDPSRDRFREPLWESAPSPISNPVTVKWLDQGVIPAVELTFPNIEYMQGFFLVGATNGAPFERTNQARSGWHVRIYRRRLAEDFRDYKDLGSGFQGGQAVNALHKLDLSSKFYLLAEVRIDTFNEGKWVDDGTIIPDYHRPLRDIHGYQAIQLYPKPDKRYEVGVRCMRRPEKLVDDTDVPVIPAEAIDCLVHKSLMLLYEHQGDMNLAQLAQARYDHDLGYLKKRYAEQRPPQTPIKRRMARARVGLGRGGIRRWWTTD